mmetsp:Transcript_3785/g.9223  ORF Transcript_3785/g.9223 Transcript_3785/m.9223 type:complete len:207 (+) Transcript_3785:2340-2960(+)
MPQEEQVHVAAVTRTRSGIPLALKDSRLRCKALQQSATLHLVDHDQQWGLLHRSRLQKMRVELVRKMKMSCKKVEEQTTTKARQPQPRVYLRPPNRGSSPRWRSAPPSAALGTTSCRRNGARRSGRKKWPRPSRSESRSSGSWTRNARRCGWRASASSGRRRNGSARWRTKRGGGRGCARHARSLSSQQSARRSGCCSACRSAPRS